MKPSARLRRVIAGNGYIPRSLLRNPLGNDTPKGCGSQAAGTGRYPGACSGRVIIGSRRLNDLRREQRDVLVRLDEMSEEGVRLGRARRRVCLVMGLALLTTLFGLLLLGGG